MKKSCLQISPIGLIPIERREHTVKAKDIKTLVLIGAGIMGEGIVQSFSQGGLSVRLIDLNKDILEKSSWVVIQAALLYRA